MIFWKYFPSIALSSHAGNNLYTIMWLTGHMQICFISSMCYNMLTNFFDYLKWYVEKNWRIFAIKSLRGSESKKFLPGKSA